MTHSPLQEARVALVHDWLNQVGGAENVLEELAALFPAAPVYTSFYAAERMPAAYRAWDIRTTFMQRLPGIAAHHQRYMPLYPLAFGGVDVSGYDLVLSNKSGFCHGVRAHTRGRRARHVCYCLTPTRFIWLYDQYRAREQIGAWHGHARAPGAGVAAPLGLCRSPARRPLHRHQHGHPGAHPPLLSP